jgi:hypothetical protein
VPAVASYPKSNALIKTSKRNPQSVLAAVNAVNQTAHKTAIVLMGGVAAVSAAIYGAIIAISASACTIMAVMSNLFLHMMQWMQLMTQQDAIYAILVKLL